MQQLLDQAATLVHEFGFPVVQTVEEFLSRYWVPLKNVPFADPLCRYSRLLPTQGADVAQCLAILTHVHDGDGPADQTSYKLAPHHVLMRRSKVRELVPV